MTYRFFETIAEINIHTCIPRKEQGERMQDIATDNVGKITHTHK